MILELVAALALVSTTPSQEIGLDPADLCQFVAENLSDTNDPRLTPYVWRTRLFRAAGVDPANDDPAIIRAKMQAYWNRHREALICNVPNSVVRDGSILKLAADSSSSEFLTDVVRRWQLDLNQIDYDTIHNDIEPRGETVLDFVEQEMERAVGTPRESILRRYRNWLVGGGARRARDLPGR